MPEDLEQAYYVVVGTGAAGLATAMGARDAGQRPAGRQHGPLGRQHGDVRRWLVAAGQPVDAAATEQGDSREEALDYLRRPLVTSTPASSRARKEAFVDGVADFVSDRREVRRRSGAARDYPDYYPELPGRQDRPRRRGETVRRQADRRQPGHVPGAGGHADHDRRRLAPGSCLVDAGRCCPRHAASPPYRRGRGQRTTHQPGSARPSRPPSTTWWSNGCTPTSGWMSPSRSTWSRATGRSGSRRAPRTAGRSTCGLGAA